MYELIMRSRWIAGLFAAVTLISVATFVAEGGGADTVAPAAEAAGSEVAPPAPAVDAAAAPAPAPVVTEAPDGFTEDESLVDPALSDDGPAAMPTEAGPD